MSFSTDRDTLFENMDRSSPDRFLLTDGATDARGMVTCYVHIPEQEPVQPGARVFMAIGRTARYQLGLLQSTKHFRPVSRPFVIRRDDGHEISYG